MANLGVSKLRDFEVSKLTKLFTNLTNKFESTEIKFERFV